MLVKISQFVRRAGLIKTLHSHRHSLSFMAQPVKTTLHAGVSYTHQPGFSNFSIHTIS